jgi:hypothetical protein
LSAWSGGLGKHQVSKRCGVTFVAALSKPL